MNIKKNYETTLMNIKKKYEITRRNRYVNKRTPKKNSSKLTTFVTYNKYGIKFNIIKRSIKMKNYLNKLAREENMPYKIFQQNHIWYIKSRKQTYEFLNGLFLFDD